MSFKCKIGIHVWDACLCTQCGEIRDDHHVFTDNCEKCSKCGKTFEDQHHWTRNCERCSKCGKTRHNHHDWSQDCEKCSKCGTHRHGHHHLVNGSCEICGHGIYKEEGSSKAYKVVKIGNQTIMAENYATIIPNGKYWTYDNDEMNIVKFGYLYDWETAKIAAPKGWHLPTKEEWDTLYHDMGNNSKKVYEMLKTGGKSGFDCLFGGWRYASGSFVSLSASAHFWCNTPHTDNKVWHFKVSAYKGEAVFEPCHPNLGLSIRLFHD